MSASGIRSLESEAGFRVLFECATIGIIVIDDTGIIQQANPCANTLFGYPEAELVGQRVEVLIPDALRRKHTEHRNDYFANPKARPMGIGIELYAKKNDGTIFPVEISLGYYTLEDENLAVAFVTDITEQARARRVMAEREAWFRNIAENSPVMIWMSGTDKLCNYFNKSWLDFTGRTMEQEKGNGWAEGVHPDDFARCIDIYTAAFDSREPFEMEYRLRKHDGEYRWISDNGKPAYLPDGTFNGYIGSCADIHERYTLNKELEARVHQRTLELNDALEREKELSDLKSRFVSIASHEFRTPLSALLSSAALAQQYVDRSDSEKAIKHLEKIKASVKNLNDILNDFLSVDKLEQGEVGVSAVSFDLREFVGELVDEMGSFLKQGQSISQTLEGSHMITQDRHILRNILINLLSNASKYSGEGTIDLLIESDSQQIRIKVVDRGIGIPEDQQMHIFGRFFRAGNTGTVQGTGLGLNIVKRYVELLEGNIRFASKSNEGTTFTVEIPATLKATQ